VSALIWTTASVDHSGRSAGGDYVSDLAQPDSRSVRELVPEKTCLTGGPFAMSSRRANKPDHGVPGDATPSAALASRCHHFHHLARLLAGPNNAPHRRKSDRSGA
jgi:hypothetical protein